MVPPIHVQVAYASAAQLMLAAIPAKLVVLEAVSVELLLHVWDKYLELIVMLQTTFVSAHQL